MRIDRLTARFRVRIPAPEPNQITRRGAAHDRDVLTEGVGGSLRALADPIRRATLLYEVPGLLQSRIQCRSDSGWLWAICIQQLEYIGPIAGRDQTEVTIRGHGLWIDTQSIRHEQIGDT